MRSRRRACAHATTWACARGAPTEATARSAARPHPDLRPSCTRCPARDVRPGCRRRLPATARTTRSRCAIPSSPPRSTPCRLRRVDRGDSVSAHPGIPPARRRVAPARSSVGRASRIPWRTNDRSASLWRNVAAPDVDRRGAGGEEPDGARAPRSRAASARPRGIALPLDPCSLPPTRPPHSAFARIRRSRRSPGCAAVRPAHPRDTSSAGGCSSLRRSTRS